MQAHAMASTLDVVKKRGYVTCGVSQGLPGFPTQMIQGRGKALMSIYAKRSQRPYLVMQIKQNSCRFRPRPVLQPCNQAKLMC